MRERSRQDPEPKPSKATELVELGEMHGMLSPSPFTGEPRSITVRVAARRAGYSESTIRRTLARGDLAGYRAGERGRLGSPKQHWRTGSDPPPTTPRTPGHEHRRPLLPGGRALPKRGRRQQRIATAHRGGWPGLPRRHLRFERFSGFVDERDETTYRVHRGEVDQATPSIVAYFIDEYGDPVFLEERPSR